MSMEAAFDILSHFVLDPTPLTLYSQQRVFAVQVFELHRLIKVRWSSPLVSSFWWSENALHIYFIYI